MGPDHPIIGQGPLHPVDRQTNATETLPSLVLGMWLVMMTTIMMTTTAFFIEESMNQKTRIMHGLCMQYSNSDYYPTF